MTPMRSINFQLEQLWIDLQKMLVRIECTVAELNVPEDDDLNYAADRIEEAIALVQKRAGWDSFQIDQLFATWTETDENLK